LLQKEHRRTSVSPAFFTMLALPLTLRLSSLPSRVRPFFG